MDVDIKPGKYVVAVSGGVDSMVLLDVLAKQPGLELIVAHFEHGVREDSMEDCRLVEAAAKQYKLPFIYEQGNLGPGISEAHARDARYTFLRKVLYEQGAQAIITAHHQDDMVETAILNLLRGTGRKGLSSLRSAGDIIRPLLHISKEQIRQYAVEHDIAWREDSTNQDEHYLRNYLRLRVLPAMTKAQRGALLESIQKGAVLNDKIDALLGGKIQTNQIDRHWFIMLPHVVAREAMAAWLRHHGAAFDRKAIDRLVVFAKTANAGKQADIDKNHKLQASKEYITLSRPHRLPRSV
ncbi:MAG TPA: tRNA lysidine(34) synthetase TilS [Patescibacteria group bacterium]|nr:tRNA lysidine(34) synthetase TilS [Patescibacteria group bacterium]